MNVKAKKIIAKEILILILCIALTIIFWISFNISNYYQTYKYNKANKENLELELKLNKPIELLDKKNEQFRKKIFNQFCLIEGGIKNGKYVSPLPNKLIIKENIGEIDSNSKDIFEEFGGHEIFFDRLCIMNFNKNEIKNLIDALGLPTININNFITQSEFYEKLLDNNDYKNEVFVKLKERFADKNCNTIDEFNKLIGINNKFLLKIKEKNEIIDKIKINTNKKIESQKKMISSKEISKNTFNFLLIIFIILFILRYFYFLTKWAIKTLRFNEK
jgi:hypothetical protein